jgi:hypothetical protein
MTRLVLFSLSASTVIGWKCARRSIKERLRKYYTIALFLVKNVGRLDSP